MNPDCTPKLGQSNILYWSKLPGEKVSVNRHFQASWASQLMGCLLISFPECYSLSQFFLSFTFWSDCRLPSDCVNCNSWSIVGYILYIFAFLCAVLFSDLGPFCTCFGYCEEFAVTSYSLLCSVSEQRRSDDADDESFLRRPRGSRLERHQRKTTVLHCTMYPRWPLSWAKPGKVREFENNRGNVVDNVLLPVLLCDVNSTEFQHQYQRFAQECSCHTCDGYIHISDTNNIFVFVLLLVMLADAVAILVGHWTLIYRSWVRVWLGTVA